MIRKAFVMQVNPDQHAEDEERWNRIAETPSCRRWWTYMKDIMASNPDDSPYAKDLREVFHID